MPESVAPDAYTLCTVVDACSRAGQTATALRLFDEMVAQGLQPTPVAYASALKACEQGNLWRRAAEIW